MPNPPAVRHILLGLTAVLGLGTAAFADGDKGASRVPLLPKYQQECGACHVAFPPGMLPPASWQRVMNGLRRHYGTDASLDAATAKELSAWITSAAATGKRRREAPPQDRITRSSWFLDEHDEVPAAAWKLPAVKSPANCPACHARADQGDFNEHDVRIPR